MRTLLSLFFTITLLSQTAVSQDSGLEMLSISPSPYSLSKAEATVSLPDGAASAYINPALLALNSASTIDLGYSSWIADVNNLFGGINLVKGNQAIAFGFYSSGSSDYEYRDRPGPSENTFSIQYLSVSASYAYDFNWFALGATAMYLNEANYTYRASGYAFNIGAARAFSGDRIRTGISLTNMGEMTELNTTQTEVPTTFRAGASADLIEFSAQKNNELPVLLSVYADYVQPLASYDNKDYADYESDTAYLNLGLSFLLAETVEISGGYKTQNSVRPVSFGASVHSENIRFNYALIPFNTGFGTVHSIGIQYKF